MTKLVRNIIIVILYHFLVGNQILHLGTLVAIQFELEALRRSLFLDLELVLQFLVLALCLDLFGVKLITLVVKHLNCVLEQLDLDVEELDSNFGGFCILSEFVLLCNVVLEIFPLEEIISNLSHFSEDIISVSLLFS